VLVKQRPFGRTGRTVAELAFGGRGLDRDRQRVLLAALDGGVDLVDVSPQWGDSESLAGEAIRELRLRDRAVLATRAPADLRALQRSVEASLRATRLDVLPLVQLPDWTDAHRDARDHAELLDIADRLVREGKVQWWGVVAPEPRRCVATLDEPWLTSVQARFHVQDRRAAAILPRVAEKQVALLTCSPLDGGLFDPDTALEFVLAEPAITCALTGTADLAHLDHLLTRGAAV
jgi:aryl-alcohol dehydrogenase-like predicted oxidoreductase